MSNAPRLYAKTGYLSPTTGAELYREAAGAEILLAAAEVLESETWWSVTDAVAQVYGRQYAPASAEPPRPGPSCPQCSQGVCCACCESGGEPRSRPAAEPDAHASSVLRRMDSTCGPPCGDEPDAPPQQPASREERQRAFQELAERVGPLPVSMMAVSSEPHSPEPDEAKLSEEWARCWKALAKHLWRLVNARPDGRDGVYWCSRAHAAEARLAQAEAQLDLCRCGRDICSRPHTIEQGISALRASADLLRLEQAEALLKEAREYVGLEAGDMDDCQRINGMVDRIDAYFAEKEQTPQSRNQTPNKD